MPAVAPEVVIVGAGVIGLSAAWRLATCGVRVAICDPAAGRGASWAAAGMLAPVSETYYGEEPLARLLVSAAERWPSFAVELEERTGLAVRYRACGTVAVGVDASDRAAIDELASFQRGLGLEARRLSGHECRALVPVLAPGVAGGTEMPLDHQVDNRRVVEALRVACERSGATLIPETVRAVRLGGGKVSGVQLGGDRFLHAPVVVVATGAWTARLEGVPAGVLPPIRPVKGHVLRLRGDPRAPLLERIVRGLVHGRTCYLVPRADGSVVLGATVEERGFDDQVQAGAVHQLLHDARALVPGVDELAWEESLAGLRPGSPDNRPYVGWTSVPGLAVACGHYRNGILLAPLTADAVVHVIRDGKLPPALAPLDASRHAAA